MNKFDLELELKKMNEKLAKIKEKINKRFKKFQSREYYRCDEWEDAKRHTDAYSKSNGDESKATPEYLNIGLGSSSQGREYRARV